MGFLLGAYGKLMAGKRVRSLQARMMSVQSQMRRATREVASMEKMINAQQKQMLNNLRLFSSMQTWGMQSSVQAQLLELQKEKFGSLFGKNYQDLTDAQKKDYNSASTAYQMEASIINNQMSSMQQMTQMSMQQMQAQIEQEVEMMKELQLEPLKDLEEDLQLEKDSLESQIQIAQADYEACKEMEKAGVKTLTPQYTGQG